MIEPLKRDPSASCLNCPSYLTAQEGAAFFRKSIGTPVCARYGKPIGRIGSNKQATDTLAKHFAATCPGYGMSRPAVPDYDRASFQVVLPDPVVIGSKPNDQGLVSTCAGCKNYVTEETVAVQLGWTTGLCSAKGKLLLGNRLTLEARDCEYRSFGKVRNDTSGLTFLPEYEEGFAGAGDPVRAFMKARANFTDPTEYVTDKPVSEEDSQHGIRAWRAVLDPVTDNTVYLPIYNRDFFSDDERKLIPQTGDDTHPEDYADHFLGVYRTAVLWTELDETPALWGEPGTGKTELFRHLAWLMQLPFYRFSITGSTELEDLAGSPQFDKERGTWFRYGRLVRAWQKPCVMVIDEPNAGRNEVWQFLRPLTDNSKQLVLDMNEGEELDRHADCYLGMAMNPAWDVRNVGANMIADADANRLDHIFVELPPEEIEKEIIRTKCKHDGWEIPADKLNTVMKIAEELRGLSENHTIPVSWAIRPQLKVARLLRWFDWITAYRMASADFLEPGAREIMLDAVRSHTAS